MFYASIQKYHVSECSAVARDVCALRRNDPLFVDSSVVMPQTPQIWRLEKIATQLLTHCLYLSAMVNHDDVAGLKDIFLDVISTWIAQLLTALSVDEESNTSRKFWVFCTCWYWIWIIKCSWNLVDNSFLSLNLCQKSIILHSNLLQFVENQAVTDFSLSCPYHACHGC